MAITLGGLSYANSLLADLFYSAAIAGILVGIVAAFARKVAERAFWVGFSIAAIAYVWLALYPMDAVKDYLVLLNNQRFAITGYGRMNLATTRLLAKSYGWFKDTPMSGMGGYSASDYMDRFLSYMVIGHSAFAILIAWAFGSLGRALYKPGAPIAVKRESSA
jgi:hypothetical protein